jgi:bleomycin hydrolase
MAAKIVNATLDIYLGEEVKDFTYGDAKIEAKAWPAKLGFNANDYVELTSYSIYPMNTAVDLEVPDNWSHDLYYNVSINDLMSVVNNAFENGYSVCWDGDVSEKGFSHKHGVAIVPESKIEDMPESEQARWEGVSEGDMYSFTKPVPEKNISDADRQKAFDLYKSTDDHLMHLTGTGKDEKGTVYYKTKNSWAEDSNDFGGYLYMSEAYLRLHTVAIMVHKDAIPAAIKTKLNL